MFIISLIIGILFVAECPSYGLPLTPRFPNARYLGMAYNAITGNPDSDSSDPGFTFGVLKFTWATGATTSDGKYLVPDYIQALQTKSCSFQTETSEIFGSQGYQNHLSVDGNVEAGRSFGPWHARFTASAGYKKVNDGTNRNKGFYTSARGKCIQYQLSVNYRQSPIRVTSNFMRAVINLPLIRNDTSDRAYNAFIDTYGTHFTSQVTMGAKMVILSQFDETALTRMEETGLDVKAGIDASFRFAVKAGAETQKEQKDREEFENTRKSYFVSFVGSHPPSDGRWETWAQSTGDSPYPVRYNLVPLTRLFTKQFFPDVPSSELKARRLLLRDAYTIYCYVTTECRNPPADQQPVRMITANTAFIGNTSVSCPPRYRILSCGILDTVHEDYAISRYAIPSDSNSCECHDRSGLAICVPWCTNTVVTYSIATTPDVVIGQSNVSCPIGYKVRQCTHVDIGQYRG